MREKYWLYLSAAGFLISSLSVFFLPLSLTGSEETITIGNKIIGATFWMGIFLGIVCFLICWKKIRKTERYQEICRTTRPGWCCVVSNQHAKTVDLLLAVAVILSVLENTWLVLPEAVNLITMFFLLFTFCMHFVLNGRVYRYVMEET